MSASLVEAGPVTIVQLLGVDRGEIVDGFVGAFGIEPGDPVPGSLARGGPGRARDRADGTARS